MLQAIEVDALVSYYVGLKDNHMFLLFAAVDSGT